MEQKKQVAQGKNDQNEKEMTQEKQSEEEVKI